MGKPRPGISLLLARFFLRPVVPSHLSCGQTSQPARHDSVFHLCRIEESHFCSVFRKGKKFLLSDGERGRSLIRGRMLTCSHLLPGRRSLDFLKPVIHIIITPGDNSEAPHFPPCSGLPGVVAHEGCSSLFCRAGPFSFFPC